jgi:hypothetical protein
MLAMLAITPTSATLPSSERPAEGIALVSRLRSVVEEAGACALPGVSVKYESFMPCMWRAVATGWVKHEDAVFVADGLRNGFTAGIDVSRLAGHRWFSNYQSAVEGREPVTRAIMKRVQAGKTLLLGRWTDTLASDIKSLFGASAIFPMGATGKPLEPTELRPTDDHTRTGVNAATVLEGLRHSLNAYSEIAWFLQLDHFMRVSDVEAAFPMLPLHPDVWPFFMFRFFADQSSNALTLFLHVCGDFGAAGMPGTFKRFFVDVVVQMARSMHVLTLPMPVYVDDCTLIGECREQVDAEMEAFHTWAADSCGVAFKWLKDRMAAQVQLALGFWWDSTTLTRELEERKMLQYLEMLAAFATRKQLTLREMQSVAGRMQRALMTFPPGAAWMLVPLFMLMCRLKLPWHARRTTREVRDNFLYCAQLLRVGLGRGYYSFANFKRAPPVWTDASKGKGYAGGGFVSACGRYDFWRYGSRAARRPIDYLEGDTVVEACTRLAWLWSGCIVSIYCDNRAFQQSGAKGRSRAPRLNELVKELFLLMVRYSFVIDWIWLSSEDNVNADHLSRDREEEFLTSVYETECWSADTGPIRMSDAGRVRVLPEKRGVIADAAEPEPAPAPAPAAAPALNPDAAPYVPERVAAPLDDCADFVRRATAPPSEAAVAAAAARLGTRRVGTRRGGTAMLVLALIGCFCVPGGDCAPGAHRYQGPSYARSSIYAGLPLDLVDSVDLLMDNRLASSSWRTVKGGLKIWREVATHRGWSHILHTDDPDRGGKLAAFVMHMVQSTDLVWGTIEKYTWGGSGHGSRLSTRPTPSSTRSIGVASWTR